MDSDRPADITSPRNRWIKLARSLHRRKQRYRERAILVEGIRPVREALSSEIAARAILISSELPDSHEAWSLADSPAGDGVPALTVSPDVLAGASDTETPQGILAICEMPVERGLSPEIGTPLALIADQIRDPGNLGTLLRSALGAGVHAVYVTRGTADPYAPKVIRAGAGGHFRLRISTLDWNSIPPPLERCRIVIADASADESYDKFDWTQPSALVVGNETSGVSKAAFPHAHGRVGIPLANNLESLNAGIAGSVILFEAWRQKRNA